MKVKKFYEKNPYPDTLNKYHAELDKNKWIFKSLTETIKLGSKIADIGCGTGEFSCLLARYGDVIGFDFSKNSLKIAKKRAKDLGLNINFINDNITKERAREKFDYIFSIGVLHHISEVDKALENIKRMMHKDTIAVFIVYNKHTKFKNKQRSKISYEDTFNHPYIKKYSQKKFKKLLELHNYKVIKIWRNLPEIFRKMTNKGKLMSFCVKLTKK